MVHALWIALLVLSVASPGAAAADWGGLVGFDLDYLGENYYQELDLPLSDLTDAESGLLESSVTRLVDDVWLGGQRLDLFWRSAPGAALSLDLESSTLNNAERFGQELRARGSRRAAGGVWTLDVQGHVRDEERSLVGGGDWRTAVRGRHRRALSSSWSTEIEAGWERSRTLGDTTTFIYDYDTARARVGVEAGEGWLPVWDAHVEGVRKDVAGGLAGSYTEVSAGGVRRTAAGRGWTFDLEGRSRNYDVNGDVGSDFLEADLDVLGRPLHGHEHALIVEAEVSVSDFTEEDDLYYDYARFTVYPGWEWKTGAWSARFGPRARILRDTGGGDHDYRQWTVRAETGRTLGALGYFHLSLDAGARDYRSSDTEVITVDAVSASFIRSDFRLLDVLLLADLPLPAGFAFRILADTTLELHDGGERVHITFGTASLVRTF